MLSYDSFLVIASNLSKEEICRLAKTCKVYYAYFRTPTFWEDLIYRHYEYSLPNAQAKDYDFLSFISTLSVTECELVTTLKFCGLNLNHEKMVAMYSEDIKFTHMVASKFLAFLIEKEKRAWVNQEPLKSYTIDPHPYYSTRLHDGINDRIITAYSLAGVLLKIHHYAPRNDHGFDFLSALTKYYFTKGEAVSQIYPKVLNVIHEMPPNQHHPTHVITFMSRFGYL